MPLSDWIRTAGNVLAAMRARRGSAGPFAFDPHQQYLMPAHFGPIVQSPLAVMYPQVTTIAVNYLTDADALSRLLPPGLALAGDPLVTIFYSKNENIEWLAGGSYNLLGVNVAVRRATEAAALGPFCMVLWENEPAAIMYGRELLGIPKIFAEIDDHIASDGAWSAGCRWHGHAIVDMRAFDLAAASDEQLADARRAMADAPWLGWRYVPNVGRPGPAASHLTRVRTGAKPEQLWFGRGEVLWRESSWTQNPTQHHIINALRALPIHHPATSAVSVGSTWLYTQGECAEALGQ